MDLQYTIFKYLPFFLLMNKSVLKRSVRPYVALGTKLLATPGQNPY
jgi:hypothetical protein